MNHFVYRLYNRLPEVKQKEVDRRKEQDFELNRIRAQVYRKVVHVSIILSKLCVWCVCVCVCVCVYLCVKVCLGLPACVPVHVIVAVVELFQISVKIRYEAPFPINQDRFGFLQYGTLAKSHTDIK